MLTFQDLYESYAAEIYRFAFWLVGDGLEAEDITSETLVRAWTSSSPIRTSTLKAYLFSIARNVYLNRQRKRKREVLFEDTTTGTKFCVPLSRVHVCGDLDDYILVISRALVRHLGINTGLMRVEALHGAAHSRGAARVARPQVAALEA